MWLASYSCRASASSSTRGGTSFFLLLVWIFQICPLMSLFILLTLFFLAVTVIWPVDLQMFCTYSLPSSTIFLSGISLNCHKWHLFAERFVPMGSVVIRAVTLLSFIYAWSMNMRPMYISLHQVFKPWTLKCLTYRVLSLAIFRPYVA